MREIRAEVDFTPVAHQIAFGGDRPCRKPGRRETDPHLEGAVERGSEPITDSVRRQSRLLGRFGPARRALGGVRCGIDSEPSYQLLMCFLGMSFILPDPFNKRRNEKVITKLMTQVRQGAVDLLVGR